MLQHNGMDAIDRKILQELSSDARLSVAELSRRIKLSPSATAERVRRLESFDLIRGYRADINLQALGIFDHRLRAAYLRRKQVQAISQVSSVTGCSSGMPSPYWW